MRHGISFTKGFLCRSCSACSATGALGALQTEQQVYRIQTLGSTCCLVPQVWKHTCKSGFYDLQQMKTAQFTHGHKASRNQQCLSPALPHDPVQKLHGEKHTDVRYQGIRKKKPSYSVLLGLLIIRGSLHCS